MSNDKKQAKYLNSPEHPLYHKSSVLYGIHRAALAIQKKNNVFLVEGYLDVIRMYEFGIMNTVAGCGTAFTQEHAKKLKKLTENVTLLADGDDAGRKAALKAVDIFLAEGLNVFVIELPDQHDPDSFLLPYACFSHINFTEYFDSNKEDAVIWKSEDI